MRLLAALFLALGLASCNEAGPETGKETAQEKVPTWSTEIAPIIFKNCTPCHRPGESGSFSLTSYREAFARAKQIRFVTKTRYMPPWPADPTYSHFIGERLLTVHEISMIDRWVQAGAPRGDSVSGPPLPEFPQGTQFRKPDLTIQLKEPVQIKGNGSDAFLILKFPFELQKDTLLDFVEFVPHQRKLVHHVNGHLVSYDAKRKFNYFAGEQWSEDTRAQLMDVYSRMNIPYTDQKQPQFPTLTPNVVYYLPGYTPPHYPGGIGGYRIKKNGLFLLNNIHYGPSNVDTVDNSVLNLFFRKDPIQRPVHEMQMGTFGVSPIEPAFLIPPGEIRSFTTRMKLSSPISILSVNPHMHLIGKTFEAFAVRPGGDTVKLIRINKWNFRWQYYYTYKNPVTLEAGTEIIVKGTFDNTGKNPDNPFHPPRTITQGNGVESMKTSEEMFQFIFTYLPYREGDEHLDLE